MSKSKKHIDTQLGHLGLSPEDNYGIPNPPIYRTSTILSSSMAQHRGELEKRYSYGRTGTPTSHAFETAICALYEAEACIAAPSGLAAITTALLAFLKSGDHALFPDSLYGSSRRFVTQTLTQYGVCVAFYPPRINHKITEHIQAETKLIYIESPGSLTFELQDTAAIIDIARSRNIKTMVDNTWGTALHYPIHKMGADIVVEAATKYICGHSDISLGVAVASGADAKTLKQTARNLGICAGPEDLYAGLRGLRTMRLRLEQSSQNGLFLAEKLQEQDKIIEILHPALKTSPDYAIFSRDFSGPCGLFGFVLDSSIAQSKLDKAIEEMEIFAIGDSWGGYESLIKQAHLTPALRQYPSEHQDGHLIRIYAGLEHPEDLWQDLNQMLERLK